MRCEQVRSLLHRYVDGELESSRANRIEMHLSHCHACEEEAGALRNFIAETEAVLSNVEAPAELEREVACSLRSQTKEHDSWLGKIYNFPRSVIVARTRS